MKRTLAYDDYTLVYSDSNDSHSDLILTDYYCLECGFEFTSTDAEYCPACGSPDVCKAH